MSGRRQLGLTVLLFVVLLFAVAVLGYGQVAGDEYRMALALQNTFRRVAGEVLPVVVEVNVVEVVQGPARGPSSPFEFFFGPSPGGREFRRPGLGSGVIVQRDGATAYVITNDHVVGNADEISVRLVDGREYDATLVGTDPRTDLALLSFTGASDVPVATLGDSESLEVGDFVLAVGNPLGFEGTVTSGIVSAVGRRPEPNASVSAFTDFIQTDASINPGNSGGALANLQGEIVGINTWIASQSGGSVGLGFAIPINVVTRAIDDFLEVGRVVYGWLGVLADDPAPQRFPGVAEALGIDDAQGVLLTNVFRGSPADTAGLIPGDFVTGIGTEDVTDILDLRRIVGLLEPGEARQFQVIRFGEEIRVEVRIGELTETARERDAEALWPGFYVFGLTQRIRSRLPNASGLNGVVVANVISGSRADRAGFTAGDVITRIDNRAVGTVEDFYRALDDGSGPRRFRVRRRGTTILLDMRK